MAWHQWHGYYNGMALQAFPTLALVHMQPPQMVFHLPMGSWGISYDIGTPRTERDLPHGWNSHRSATYRELIRVLNANQFYRHQYSDYRADGVEAHHTWAVMWSLRNIRPPMKLETTVKGLKMQFYHNRHIFDITTHVRIGGAGAHRLRNMTPANLVNGVPGRAGHPIIPPLAPGQVLYCPDYTKWSANASNPQNWRI